ncbi:MAG TPA: VanZ family protein [Rubricoccaceae bacterium]|nr:VanZ family protein [Rubricoccaceae bacterium]
MLRRLLAPRPALWLWAAAMLVVASIPGEHLPEFLLLSKDKLLHLVSFGGLAFLGLRAFPDLPLRIFAAGFAYGVLIELYQEVMPLGRFADPYDALANGVGLLLGLGAGWWAQRRRGPQPRVR